LRKGKQIQKNFNTFYRETIAPPHKTTKFILSPENPMAEEGKYFKFSENGHW
jgi:hypothetical protein